MRLIRTIQIGLLVAVFGLLSLTLTTPADAACGGDCSVSTCRICFGSGRYRVCEDVYCSNCSGRCEIRVCPPGTFPISGGDGCRDIGPVDNCPCGTKPSGVCQSCEVEPPPPPPCVPSCGAPLCGQADGCGGACANSDAGNWGAWGACNTSCGPGTQTRTNACGTSQYLSCQVNDPNVWGAWGACSATCGGGIRVRYNACGQPQAQGCNPQPCQNAWWQVKDSDVSSSGDLITNVPSGKYFDIDGTGGFPGIPAASGTTDLDGTNVSSTDWLVDSLQTNAKVYDHAFFNNQIPKDTVITVVPNNTIDGSIFESGGTLSYGYYWYRYDGLANGFDLTITAPVDLGSRKVILLVDSASLYINGRINLTDGVGFFMTSVGKSGTGTKGNIYIDPSVGSGTPDLEGIYQADGIFNTGASVVPLSVRGSVSGYGGVAMVRDLGGALNVTTPSELFEYAPDQIMLYPKVLGSRKINWKEVAP